MYRNQLLEKFKPYAKDWYISTKILDQAIDAIKNSIIVSREFHVPYVAGYSVNGRTIYIDKHFPKGFKLKNGKFVNTDKYLILHEIIEKLILDRFKVPYQFAHQMALRIEQDAVEADDIPWEHYNKFMMIYVKKISEITPTMVPKDLDLTPYKDEDDYQTLEKILNAVEQE